MKKITVSILTTLLMLSMVFSSSVFAANEETSAWDSFLGLFSAKTAATTDVGVEYRGHIQNVGNYPLDGTWIQGPTRLGTVGQSLRLEGFWIQLTNKPADVNIEYEVHVQNVGWMAPVDNGDFAGTEGKSQQIEAIKIRLVKDNGDAVTDYSVNYRGHVQNIGDTAWYTDGQQLGTDGQFLRLEALEVEIVKNPADLAAYNAALAAVTQADYTAASWTAYQAVVNANVVDEDNLQSEVDAATANITAAQANLVLIPKITAVTATNGTSVLVTFNTAMDLNTIAVGDFTFTSLDSHPVAGVLAGTLSADGRTYTIVTNDGTSYFSGRYDVAVAAGSIKSTTNQSIAKYAATLTFTDTTAPVISSVTATPTSATTANIAITFNEQVATVASGGAGTLTINGIAYQGSVVPATLSSDRLTVTYPNVAVNTDATYTGTLVGAQDIKGNIAGASNFTITVTEDVTKPTVSVTASGSTLTLVFSELVPTLPTTLTVNGTSVLGTLTQDLTLDSTGKTYTADATAALTAAGSTFLNNTPIVIGGFADAAGNVGITTTVYKNVYTDTTAPVLVSKELVNNKLELLFNERVSNAVVATPNISLSYVNASGIVITPLSGSWAAETVAGTVGKDLNNNGVIDLNTAEERYICVAFTDAAHQFTDTSNNLLAGNYTFSWAKGLFTDAATNQVAAANFTLSPTTQSTSDAIVTYTAATDFATSPVNTRITVNYSEAMSSDALTIANYKIGGAALPAGSTAVFVNDTQNVLITIPKGSITANGTRTFVVSNATSAIGNTLDTVNQTLQTLDMIENVVPTLTSITVNSANQATATFSEIMALNAGATGVTVYVNGVEDAGATVATAGGTATATIATTTTLTQSSVVTLGFASADLTDANLNPVADN